MRKNGQNITEPYLPGLAPRRFDALFFAVFPDTQAARRIADTAEHFRRAYGLKGVPLLAKRFHVTIHGIGTYDGLPPGIVERALEAGAAVKAISFDVAFDRITSFAGSDVLVLTAGQGANGVRMFHQSLGAAMRSVGLYASSTFTPHMTLLYDGRRIEERLIELIHWTVRDFVLVHSLRGRTKHIPLERWQLRE